MSRVTNCLWFNTEALPAAEFYVSLLPGSQLGPVARAPDGAVVTAQFTLDGVPYLGLNGGPMYQASPAFSISVACPDQAEIDRLWESLTNGGEPGRCGWLVDRFGVSWQIVPAEMGALMSGDRARVARVMDALMPMSKLDLAALRAARAE